MAGSCSIVCVYRIAITGGIASGKTTVSKHLESLGIRRIDADQVARDVVEPGEPALEDIRATFGSEILNADGTLNRAELGRRVFGNPDALARLNGIVHPRVRARSEQLMNEAEAAGAAFVLYDVPLLAESQRPLTFDIVVTVEAGADQQLHRLIELRGMSEAEAQARIASQASEAERRALADYVIESGGTLEETLAQTEALWEQFQALVGGTE